MGVVINIQSYQKEPSCIVGAISFLGYYEVKLEAISKFSLQKEPIVHYRELALISEIRLQDVRQYSLYPQDLWFYDLATSYWSGQSLGTVDGETTGLMFEPKVLLGPITRLLDAKDWILDSFRRTSKDFLVKEIEEYGEVETLLKMKSLIEDAIEKNGMIGITFS